MKKFSVKQMAIISAVLFAFSLVSCASTSKKVATVEDSGRMFWTINGTDKKGNPSTVYILGTIHVGDESLFPLEENTTQALFTADRVAAEISSTDMAQLNNEINLLTAKSFINAAGRNVLDNLTDAQKAVIYEMAGEDLANQFALFEPWLLTNIATNAQYASSGLTAEYGLDSNLMALLSQNNIAWDGLDALQTQLDILTYGNYEQQLYMLKDCLDSIIDPTEVNEFINKLYKAYLADDPDTIAALYVESETSSDSSMQNFTDKYNKFVLADRNSAWAKKIKTYLDEGGSTFIFAGCAHFTGEKSVFNYLKKNGVIN